MRQELAWGTAAAVAIVAAVGISSQSGGKPETSRTAGRQGQTFVRPKPGRTNDKGPEPQCSDSLPLLEHFFLHEKVTGPPSCYADKPTATPLDPSYQTNFVIATFPDPLHTHFSLLFDRFVEALQQGAQDEAYEYDSSWLPWEAEEPSFNSLKDQDEVEDRTQRRENQPGMLLFRGSGKSAYKKALVVFIVGEESTRGIHRQQFENAVAWINALQPMGRRRSVAILGPTFSGSFPSLTELFEKTDGISKLNAGVGFPVFSGSASSREDGELFARTHGVHFHSFVQDDLTALDRVCRYFEARHLSNLAILSEDETAYGYGGGSQSDSSDKLQMQSTDGMCPDATRLFYPRDISNLRAAYQTQSMFKSGSDQQNQDNPQRKSLPTDLADSAGQQHDTVRTYAGNQTPLSEEAQLLGIVDVLRAHRAEYVILRSSNTLDPLFLANFLRRDYPEARILVLNSDLIFQRGQDAMALGGVMTLSTYPLFSWAREWTPVSAYESHSHRVFPENSTEGTYIASRLLLQALARANGEIPTLDCRFADEEVFVPPLWCQVTSGKSSNGNSGASDTSSGYAPLPDYAPPFWTDPGACDSKASAMNCRPAVWLSVIARNGTWPLAALNEKTLDLKAVGISERPTESPEHQSWPATPRSTRIAFVALCGLALFQFLCCRFASFTAKPAFRAHFATPSRRHTWLVLIGSYLIALMTLFLAWGCGIFATAPSPPAHKWQIWTVVIFVCVLTGAAVLTNIVVTKRLNGDSLSASGSAARLIACLVLFTVAIAAFFLLWVSPVEGVMMLANRTFVYWRSMNLTSGVSPVVPFLSFIGGLYVWFWYALHGLALFGPDRPCLPPVETLGVKLPTGVGVKQGAVQELKLSMFSQENVADPAERMAKPLARDNIIATAILFAALGGLTFGLGHGVPFRNLGATQATAYSLIFCIALVFYCSFILSEGWKVWRTWSSARQLLVFLDRMPLRRTLSNLHGFSWGSVWKMSGNVLDVRYKLLSRQLECLNHLHNSFRLFKMPEDTEEQKAFAGITTCEKSVDVSRAEGLRFAQWYSRNYCKPDASGLQKFRDYQEQIAETTGVVLTELLVPASRIEEHSLIQDYSESGEEKRNAPRPSANELVRNAEELVCLTYLGFAQNLLGRIRTIVLGGVYLFLSLSIAVSSYPFDPRTLLSAILLLLFVAFGGIVVFTYADMHRDTTLSHITNTNPGELGSEFWLKILGYGAAPLLGLITQIFPEWSSFVFSWLQPGLSSLK